MEIKLDKKTIQDSVRASCEMEGLFISKEAEKIAGDMLDGKITGDEAVALILEKHRREGNI